MSALRHAAPGTLTPPTRLILGIWTKQYGGRPVFTPQMLLIPGAVRLLAYAQTYPMVLLAALGVGLAGGSFAIGVAYVSRWFPAESQGPALGVFGTGNVGAAVTKFLAPFVMVAWGWQAVAHIRAAALAVMALVFFVFAKGDPTFARRKAGGARSPSIHDQLEPLRNLQVWRFSLCYFFVFGGFVALVLRLSNYLVNVYGANVEFAGAAAATFSLSASLFRAYGGTLSGRFGARMVMHRAFGFASMPASIPHSSSRRRK